MTSPVLLKNLPKGDVARELTAAARVAAKERSTAPEDRERTLSLRPPLSPREAWRQGGKGPSRIIGEGKDYSNVYSEMGFRFFF